MLLRFATDERTDMVRHATILVAQHGPTIYPATGRERQHTTYAATVLEHHTIPVTVR